MQVSRCTSQSGDGQNRSLCQDDTSLQREPIVMIPESTHFKTKYGGNTYLGNIGIRLKGYTVPQARRHQSKESPP
jgi:hypothetical protein